MSLAIAKAAPLRPEIRLAQALSEYEASLAEDQKTLFREQRSSLTTPNIQDVGRFTAEVDRNAQRRNTRRCIGPRLTRFLYAVQQFSTVVDVAVGGTQSQIGCAVWGVVKFSLQVRGLYDYLSADVQASLSLWTGIFFIQHHGSSVNRPPRFLRTSMTCPLLSWSSARPVQLILNLNYSILLPKGLSMRFASTTSESPIYVRRLWLFWEKESSSRFLRPF